MINKNEIIFAVDENNQPIEPVARKKAHAEGIWHRTTDIALINDKGQILCHKRSILKDTGPGLWDPCFGGHILAGADPVDSAVVELREETGLEAANTDLEFFIQTKHVNRSEKNKEFRYAYIYKWDGDLNSLKLEADEIGEVKWFDLSELVKNRDNRAEWSPMPYLDALVNYLNKV